MRCTPMSNKSHVLSLVLPLTSFGNVLIFLFNIFLATAITCLNVSVFVSILLSRALRGENRFMYMLSTCLSDTCIGVSYYYVGVFDVNESPNSPTRTFYTIPTFQGISFMAILAAQADRYHAVVSPFKYSLRMTRNRTLMVICSYWIYAFFIVALHNLLPSQSARQITNFGGLAGNVLAVIFMIGFNIRLFIIAKNQLGKEAPSDERDSKRSSVYLILVVAVFFIGTWVPFFCGVVICLLLNIQSCSFKNEGTDPFRILPRVNAALTPILYIKGCAALKASLYSTVCRACSQRR
ncbi:uncharacterized protein LOC118599186 isoform X2 [Oryzias melastigma]|uniref:uncharacterized protein LOC118599186 isoform X2 n=1 Tax=Oryzias melastigma TaxID=30732 RepID=UPI00168D2956|nr:uncharacterized protein LOC118599186 isoform X2 [Oryzias melastigma]